MLRRLTLFHLITTLLVFSLITACEKDATDESDNSVAPDSYDLPWYTSGINYVNIANCSGNRTGGYQLFYKDSLLRSDCQQYGGISITDSMLIDQSTLHLFFVNSNSSYDLMTQDGGSSWTEYPIGPPVLYSTHYVTDDLIYCVTKNQNDLYFTGIGSSDLFLHKDFLRAGTHSIKDMGVNIPNMDSTLIQLNDSVSFVIKFVG